MFVKKGEDWDLLFTEAEAEAKQGDPRADSLSCVCKHTDSIIISEVKHRKWGGNNKTQRGIQAYWIAFLGPFIPNSPYMQG